MTIGSFLFDMDGVIVDSLKYHVASWKQVLAEYDIFLEDIDIYKREGMSGKDSIMEIFAEKGRSFPADSEFQVIMEKKQSLFERHSASLYPSIPRILSYIYSKNVPMALVTGSMKRSVYHVIPQEILSQFDTIITADDVTKGKPDPEPYALALARMGQKKENALAVENAPMGIQSAKRAGTVCYAIETTLPREYLTQADRIFQDHCSFYDFLKAEIK